MNHGQLQDAILSCTPDSLWKQAVREKSYVFTEKELMFIAYQQTLTFEKRLEAIDLLGENASPRTSAFARKISAEMHADWELFKQSESGCIFELEINAIHPYSDKHFICDSFSSAMRFISCYILEHEFIESEIRGYTILKRKVTTANFPAKVISSPDDSDENICEDWDEIEIGKCTFAAGRFFGQKEPVLLSVRFEHSRYYLYDNPNFCDGNGCSECEDPCFEGEMTFPKILHHGDIVQYRCGDYDLAYFNQKDGECYYGINIEWSPSQEKDRTAENYYIVCLYTEIMDDLKKQSLRFLNQYDHLPAPYIQRILSVEELPENLQDGYRACLNAYKKYRIEEEAKSTADS